MKSEEIEEAVNKAILFYQLFFDGMGFRHLTRLQVLFLAFRFSPIFYVF